MRPCYCEHAVKVICEDKFIQIMGTIIVRNIWFRVPGTDSHLNVQWHSTNSKRFGEALQLVTRSDRGDSKFTRGLPKDIVVYL